MDKFGYVVALVAVITGLGLGDVAVSLHRLLKQRAGVVWDFVPVTLALYLGLALIRLWYQLWSVRADAGVTDLPFVTFQVVQTLVLALAASAALPDENDFRDGRVDLREYYSIQARYIWTMYLVFELMWLATGLYFSLDGGWNRDGLGRLLFLLTYFGIPLALTSCALTMRRSWHGPIVALLMVHEVLIPSNFFGLLRQLAVALNT